MKKKATSKKPATEEARIEYIELEALRRYPKNPKEHDLPEIEASFIRYGFVLPPVIDETSGFMVAGHGRLDTCIQMKAEGKEPPARVVVKKGRWLIPVIRGIGFKNVKEAEAYLLADNRISEKAGWNPASLIEFLQRQENLQGTGFDAAALAALLEEQKQAAGGGDQQQQDAQGSLQKDFLVPPFSVLDSRQGYWQDRKRSWLALGIESHEGRGDSMLKFSDTVKKTFSGNNPNKGKGKGRAFGQDLMKGEHNVNTGAADSEIDPGAGTSIFDPVLCELAYRWFLPSEAARILDPFAGGSVRGITAGFLGYRYIGVDLRKEQVDANIRQAKTVKNLKQIPVWLCGDSRKLKGTADETGLQNVDMVFSCPPYFDLEKYSDDPKDLSNLKSYLEFIEDYREIIRLSCELLAQDSFAVFVVGDIRDKEGIYRNFTGETIQAFLAAGLKLYNWMILVNSVGSLPIRVRKQFETNRKVGKVHQDVLCFFKGDPRRIGKKFPKLRVPDMAEQFGEVLPPAVAES